jgi:hypothetical protein
MASCDDIVGWHQGATAHERTPDSTTEQGDLVRELPIGGISAADNAAATPAQVRLMGCLQQLGRPRGA